MDRAGETQSMICILVSLKKEIDLFLDCMQKIEKERSQNLTVYNGKFRGTDIRIVKTGMGYQNIEPAFVQECSLIISTGFCGAMSTELKAGDVVVSEEVVFAGKQLLDLIFKGDVQKYPMSRSAVLTLSGAARYVSLLRDDGLQVYSGRTLTAGRIIRNFKEKRKLYNHFQALSVDMEDFFRVGMARKLGISVVGVRAVLDETRDIVPLQGRVPLRGKALLMKGGIVPFFQGIPSLLKGMQRAQKSISIALEKILSGIA